MNGVSSMSEKIRPNQVVDRCDSTHLLARELIHEGFSHGTWISCRIQDKGRGRLGRVWKSEEGNLFLSIILELENRALWSWVPLCVAVAVTDCLKKHHPELAVQIKWPNDLWVCGKKLGGILCESVSHQGQSYIIAGIGLNHSHAPVISLSHVNTNDSAFNSAQSQDQAVTRNVIQATALREHIEDRSLLSLDQLRTLIIHSILSFINQLKAEGNTPIQQRYQEWSVFTEGSQVSWGEVSPRKVGKVLGLGQYGELRVLNQDGQIESLYSEDVTSRVHSYEWHEVSE